MPNIARFYYKPKENKRASKDAGHLVYDQVEMIEITIPGDRTYQPHFPAHESCVTYDAALREDDLRTWAERYPEEYRAFKMNASQDPLGTPVEQWPVLSRQMISQLKALGLPTVESIASMNPRNRGALGASADQLIAQANVFVSSMKPVDDRGAMMDELAAMRAEIEELRKGRGPGRPRKEVEAA